MNITGIRFVCLWRCCRTESWREHLQLEKDSREK